MPASNMSEQENKQEHQRMWLNNFVNRHKLGRITYSDEFQQQTWVSNVQLNGTTIGDGEAGNKDGARENAARQALKHLQSQQSN
ncbi:hypothetical protein M378DRAFT_161756 [Amanita muscaria Koide BX008]|uniref:DRBM domain-containing protein n=1 Tax=Amanita muscaria (strain Koide BX008) TaxID=946122 RepID=A0A0C2SR35_AMAMK|nr:hypothetical protein M378DRAFT_161756 [Amanita muscaria Koide BX008]